MRLFKFKKIQDFGTDYEFTFLQGKLRSFIQLSVGWAEYPSWPYLQVSLGMNNLLDILFFAHSFSLNFTIFSYNWNRD